MCIAIMIPKGAVEKLTFDMLQDCYLINGDGIGYSFPDGCGGLVIKKFMSFTEFLAEWGEDKEENDEHPIMLHFRATSVGETDLDNCHPFSISETQVFCHNGTIARVDDDPKKIASDTRMFNRLFLRDLPEDWESSYPIVEMMKCYIGTSKFIILNADDSYSIINEKLGVWDMGIWFSNEHYTGEYARGNGVAYKKATKHITNYYHPYNSKASDRRRERKRAREKRERSERFAEQNKSAYSTHPSYPLTQSTNSGNSSEVMCDFCSVPYDESELILVEWGNTEESFSVCHVCVNKIHFDEK